MPKKKIDHTFNVIAVAVALIFIAYRPDTSREQARAVKTPTAAAFAAEVNEPEL